MSGVPSVPAGAGSGPGRGSPFLLPVVAAQGIWVRSRTERLPPAAGPTGGTVGDRSRPAVRIAVLGESTAAGCGVRTHDEGIGGCLARALARRTGRPVEWEVVGADGATIRRIRHRLLPRLSQHLDVAVLLAGVNDVLGRRGPGPWGEDLAAVVGALADRAGRVAVSGIPPFGAFPALPTTLGRYLARSAAALDEVSRRICAEHPGVTWIGSAEGLPMGPDFFARDRFHPSAAGYRDWAEVLAARLPL